MKIAIGGDHAGYDLKLKVIELLEKKGLIVEDFGPFSTNSCDYPDYVHPLAKSVVNHQNDLGIVICGSGNGVNIVANKYQEIRSALCWDIELAQMAKAHNNANVLAIPARYISEELALKIVDTFLTTDFEGGRHANRVNKIAIQ
jgi:ribose 5-phosphate isomerase B